MENYKKKAVELLMGLAVNESKDPAVIPYIPSKVASSGTEKRSIKRNHIAAYRKYAKVLLPMLRELEEEKRANIHNLMIVKDGEVICEVSAPGYSVNIYHLAHSMSKSVTALAVGLLIDEGKLTTEERIIDIFPEMPFCDPRFSDITVEDLLTMRSGVPFSEIGTVTTDKWTDTFFESELTAPSGECFHYNSMNSYILAKIVTRIAKTRLSDYLRDKLFSPLGIDNYLWEIGPEGTEKGGYGLYLSCESFAKIGMLILGGGEWEGKRIISSEFIKAMTSTHQALEDGKSGFDYGYHLWTSKDSSDLLLNGMLGQNVLICPAQNMVISLNAGNNELFSDSPALEIIKKYKDSFTECKKSTPREMLELYKKQKSFFSGRHWIRPLPRVRGLRNLYGILGSEPFDKAFEPILGSYAFADNNTSLLPVFVSVMQNNYVGGIERIAFERRSDKLYLTSVEGGISYEIPLGLYGYEESMLHVKGERYIVRAYAEAMEDEDRNPVYKIELIFPELPNTRMIKVTHATDGIRLRLSETPNQRVAERFFSSFTETGKMGFAVGLLEKRVGEDFISTRLTSVFNPDMLGIDMSIDGWQDVMESLKRELSIKRESGNKFVKNVVNRFIGEDKEEKHKEEKPKSGGFLSKAFTAIISKLAPGQDKDDQSTSAFDLCPLDLTCNQDAKNADEPTKNDK